MSKDNKGNLNELKDKLTQLYEIGLVKESANQRLENIAKITELVKKCEKDPNIIRWEKLFKALGSKTRLMILKTLFMGISCACEIEHTLQLSQSTVSHHLKILNEAGIIEMTKTGKWNIVSIEGQELSKEFFLSLIKQY
ncbi:MAG: ArsR/SmtB family transcription factor [Candidatus Heimdallarchaeaceae archaeon]